MTTITMSAATDTDKHNAHDSVKLCLRCFYLYYVICIIIRPQGSKHQ